MTDPFFADFKIDLINACQKLLDKRLGIAYDFDLRMNTLLIHLILIDIDHDVHAVLQEAVKVISGAQQIESRSDSQDKIRTLLDKICSSLAYCTGAAEIHGVVFFDQINAIP